MATLTMIELLELRDVVQTVQGLTKGATVNMAEWNMLRSKLAEFIAREGDLGSLRGKALTLLNAMQAEEAAWRRS
jgi:hypothetical protein